VVDCELRRLLNNEYGRDEMSKFDHEKAKEKKQEGENENEGKRVRVKNWIGGVFESC